MTRALRSLIALSLVSAAGCQAFAPAAIGSLTATRQEKRMVKQAEVDPFPSPSDVGLSTAAAGKPSTAKR